MASWNALEHQPSFNADTMLLLTDGTVMCHEYESANWHRLTPDSTGSYIKGTWSSLAALPDDSSIPSSVGGPTNAPLYFASAVLRDGRVFVAGGEYNTGIANADITATQIYDPLADAWTAIDPPPVGALGDAASCLLADGRLLIGTSNDSSTATAVLDPETQIWESITGKADSPSEESWTLLPNGNVLAVECSNSPNAEQYNPTENKWIAAGSTPSDLTQPCPGNVAEIGPALVLPDGRVFAIGASGATALYTPNADATVAGTWSAGPGLTDAHGNTMYPMDAPAALLPSGKVLLTAGPAPPCNYPGPTTFYLYDPSTNAATIVTGPSNNSQPVYHSRLLLLPNGQVLHSNNSSDIEVYTPDGTPDASWAPVISDCPTTMVTGHTYTISGTQFNGLSQACSYGDDAQMATNYPIVRLSNGSGKVQYLRSSNFSTMGVATGSTLVTADVTVPTDVAPGPWELVVVANGIPSGAVPVQIAVQDLLVELGESDYSVGQIQAAIEVSGKPVNIDDSLYIRIEGFTHAQVGGNRPTVPDPIGGVSFTVAAPIPDDPSASPLTVQGFTFPATITFQDDSMFTSSDQTVTVNASFTSLTGDTVFNAGQIVLLSTPNPYILHGDIPAGYPWYLSTDLRVFQITAGQTMFGKTIASSGDPADVATTYIGEVIDYLNNHLTQADSDFSALPQAEDVATVNLAPTDGSGHNVYNFALARVRYQDVQPATEVRVFFRMWQAQQTNATFDPSTYYRSHVSGTHKIPLLGIEGDEIVTIPFFAAQRVDTTSVSMDTQTDPKNVRTIQPGSGGALVDAYYGCWLDVNQPGQSPFPPWLASVANVDGPYAQPLVSVQQLVRATHQCLIAEIAFDPDPIPSGADPSTTDKLAQRNLTFINIPNPGLAISRLVPQPLEIRPSRRRLPSDDRPDELMIDWGNTPAGSVASLYLPAVPATDILNLADRLYATHTLTLVDDRTIACPARGMTYLPIPPSASSLGFAGLMTLAVSADVTKGERYEVTVRQLTTAGAAGDTNTVPTPEARRELFWRRVAGIFHLSIPVGVKEDLLAGEERTFAILCWIFQSIPAQSRWYPVFARLLAQLGERIFGMGGDPTRILPSPTGTLPGRGPGRGGRRIEFTGKVLALCYDHFGDFEGFVLTRGCDEEHRFCSREPHVERIVHRALTDRATVTVLAEAGRPDCPVEFIIGGWPPMCC